MRVTFDTNTLDKAARPERFLKDCHQPDYLKVRAALLAGKLSGFFPEAAITLEGVQNGDRVEVFGSTRLRMQPLQTFNDSEGISHVEISAVLTQDRKPLHPENEARMYAALALKMRALRGPARVAWVRVNDPDCIFFADQDDDPLMPARVERATEAGMAIEARGLGSEVARALGEEFSARAGIEEPWFQGLRRARDVHERRRVQRAIAEWADADGVAAHIGHANDVFCTADRGKSAGIASIFDAANRTWLSQTYGVRFLTLPELAREI